MIQADGIQSTTGVFSAQASGTGGMNPQLFLADKGSPGFPYPHGLDNQNNGFAAVSGPNTNQPFFVNFYVVGDDDTHPNAQAVTLRLWSRGNSAGNSDNGIEGFMANGAFASPTHVRSGQFLMKLAGFGYATNGYAINDAAVICLNADQDFSNTGVSPDPTNTKAGGSVSIETCNLNENNQHVRAVFDSLGNFAFGEFPRGGNNFPGKGVWVFKNSVQIPSTPVPGAGIFYVKNSQPYWLDGSHEESFIPNKVLWNASGSIVKAHGVDSITKNGTGDFTIHFLDPFSDADSFVPSFFGQGRYAYAGRSNQTCRVQSFDSSGNFKDFDVNYGVFFGI